MIDGDNMVHVLGNIDYDLLKTKVKEAIDEILLDEKHQVAEKDAYAYYGITPDWLSSGTAVPAGETNTALNISGKGRLTEVDFFSKYNSLHIHIDLDGSRVNRGRVSPKALYDTFGQVGKYGFVDFSKYDTANDKYTVIYCTAEIDGKFGSSCKISVYNPDTTAHECAILVNYYTLASKQFKAVVNQQFDPLQLRQTICSKAKVPMSYVTVELSTQFNEEKNQNETVVSVMEHVKTSDLERAIVDVLKKYFNLDKEQIEITEY